MEIIQKEAIKKKKKKTVGKAKTFPSATQKMRVRTPSKPHTCLAWRQGRDTLMEVFLETSTGADSAFFSSRQDIPTSTQCSVLPEEGQRTTGNGRRGGQTASRGGSEYSPSVPSGSIAQGERAASRPAGTGRKTSPGSWR